MDTCVWLNLADDYRHLPLLHKMATMVEEGEIEFIIPEIVLEEFKRNRDRVMKASTTSQKELFKRVRATGKQFGTGDTESILAGIFDVEQKLHMHGYAVDETLAKVEHIMGAGVHVVLPKSRGLVPTSAA